VEALKLEILRLVDEWSEIDVILLDDIKEYILGTYTIPYGKKGERVKLPLWVAKYFMEKKLATIDVEEITNWINRVYWREKVQKTSPYTISRIPADFYPKAKLILYMINKKLIEDKTDIRKKILEIFNKRKVAIHFLSELEESELIDRLSEEEKILLSIYSKVGKVWKGFWGIIE
jgi:hypothetical protein